MISLFKSMIVIYLKSRDHDLIVYTHASQYLIEIFLSIRNYELALIHLHITLIIFHHYLEECHFYTIDIKTLLNKLYHRINQFDFALYEFNIIIDIKVKLFRI